MQHGEKLLLLHCLPTSCGPRDLISSLPQDPQILLGVSSYWNSALLLAVFAPSPPYLSWLPIIAALHCRGTSSTELCMLLWLKQTKRISLFKELMLGFCIQRSQSREVSLAVSCGWQNWSMRRWNEFAYWTIIPLPHLPHISQPTSWAKALLCDIQPRQRQSQRNKESCDTKSHFFFSFSKNAGMYKRTKKHSDLCKTSEWQPWCLQSFGHFLNVLNNDASKILTQQHASALTWGERDEYSLW